VLSIDRAYFGLTGGLERWLYRLVRKHGGRQSTGYVI
jgi:plasmid replication initiation protein